MFDKMAIRVLSGYHAENFNKHSYNKNRKFHALSMRLHGSASFTCNQKHITVNPGDILYIPAHVDYFVQTQYEDLLVIHFEAYPTREKPETEIFSFTPHNYEHFAQLFQNIIAFTDSALNSAALLATSEMYRLLADIEHETELSNTVFTPGMTKAVTYLHNHFMDPAIDLPILTHMAAVSDTYFRRMFAAVYDTTPIKYLTGLRIDYAHKLLLSGMYTVEEVSYKSGFNDAKYFSKQFKRIKGFSPSAVK